MSLAKFFGFDRIFDGQPGLVLIPAGAGAFAYAVIGG